MERRSKYVSAWRLVANHLNMASPLGGCSFWRDESGQDVVWHADDLFPLPACVIPQGGGRGGGGEAGGAEISLGSEADA